MAADFFAVDFFAVDFLAVEEDAFFAGAADEAFLAGAFFAVEDDAAFFAGAFLAGAFLAGAFFAVEDEAFFAVEDAAFVAGAFFAGAFFAGAFFAVVDELEPVAFEAVDDFADREGVAALAAAAAVRPGAFAAASVSFGSFLAPETTFLRSAPAENFGTAVFLALIRCPVWGLRTQRASRTRFSKEPNPVIATFSPLATSRVMVSSTDSSAC